MAVPATKSTHHTIDEYLRRERQSVDKHEYRDGEILLMSGGTMNHSLIIANVIRELGNRLKGTPCRVFDSNLRVRIPPTILYTYPDVSILCGKHHADPQDPSGETITNPRVVIEVLSDSTEAYDRGAKFTRYRMLESLEEYVLVAQNTPTIETYLRQSGGTWLLTPTNGREATARIRCLSADIPLIEVYAGVEFPPPKEPPAEAR
jgi:Uma2 family endonuclease